MVTKNGTIIFHKWKELSKQVGEDRAYDMIMEVIRRLEATGMVSPNSMYSSNVVQQEAERLVKILKVEWKDDKMV
jgi:hypothetical protein